MKINQDLWEEIKKVPELEHLQNDWQLLPNTIHDFKNKIDDNFYFSHNTRDIQYRTNNLVIEYDLDYQLNNYNGKHIRLDKLLHGKSMTFFDNIVIRYYWKGNRLL